MMIDGLFSNWRKFYLEVASNKLDVLDFTLKMSYNQPLQLTAKVLLPKELLLLRQQPILKTKLVLTPTSPQVEDKVIHGIVTDWHQYSNQDTPIIDGLCCVELHIASQLWGNLSGIGVRCYHRLTIDEMIKAVLSDVKFESKDFQASFNCHAVNGRRKTLRRLYHQNWQALITRELSQENLHYYSEMQPSGEVIHCLSAEQLLTCPERARSALQASELNRLHLCYPEDQINPHSDKETVYNLSRHTARDIPYTSYQFYSLYPQAFPGDIHFLFDGARFADQGLLITDIELTGKHRYEKSAKLDGALDGECGLVNKITAIPLERLMHFHPPALPQDSDRMTTVYTGRIEAHQANQTYPDRNQYGQYQARYDFDQQIETRRSNKSTLKPVERAQALQNVRATTLMPGKDSGVELPLHDGTEVALTYRDHPTEPAFILGALNNQQSPAPVTKKNAQQHIFRTWAGNELCIEDNVQQQYLRFSTYKQELSFSMHYPSNLFELIAQKGEMEWDVGRAISIKNKAIHSMKIERKATLWVKGRLGYAIKKGGMLYSASHHIYSEARQKLLTQSVKATLNSNGKLLLHASDGFIFKSSDLNLLADKGRVLLHAKKLLLKNKNLLAQTKQGAQLKLTKQALKLSAPQKIILDIKNSCPNTNGNELSTESDEHIENLTPPKLQPFKRAEIPLRYDFKNRGHSEPLEPAYRNDDSRIETQYQQEEPHHAETKSAQSKSAVIEPVVPTNDNKMGLAASVAYSFSRSVSQHHKLPCWECETKQDVSVTGTAKFDDGSKSQLMLSLSNNQALGDKIGELVAKDVTHNTQVTTNNSGLIKYSCGYKELKDFTFDFEAGVDKKTMRPSIATTINYDFKEFKIETPNGILTITGTASFKIQFLARPQPLLCSGLSKMRNMLDVPVKYAYHHPKQVAEAGGAILMTAGTGAIVYIGGELTASALGYAAGQVLEYASIINSKRVVYSTVAVLGTSAMGSAHAEELHDDEEFELLENKYDKKNKIGISIKARNISSS